MLNLFFSFFFFSSKLFYFIIELFVMEIWYWLLCRKFYSPPHTSRFFRDEMLSSGWNIVIWMSRCSAVHAAFHRSDISSAFGTPSHWISGPSTHFQPSNLTSRLFLFIKSYSLCCDFTDCFIPAQCPWVLWKKAPWIKCIIIMIIRQDGLSLVTVSATFVTSSLTVSATLDFQSLEFQITEGVWCADCQVHRVL